MGAVLAIVIPLLLQLLEQVVPALGPLFVALLNNLAASMEDESNLAVLIANQEVQGIDANPANAEKTSDEKYQMAFDAMKLARPNLSDSMVNCLIELAVQKLKEKQ